MTLTTAQVTMFTNWVTRRRQPHRDAAGQAVGGSSGPTDAAATRPRVTSWWAHHRARYGHRRPDDAVPHGAADRDTPNGATSVATCINATTASLNPARQIGNVGSIGDRRRPSG